MKLSLRLLILVLLAAVPVLAIQVQDLLQDREQRKAAIAQQALDLARLAAAQQDQFIESARYLLAAAAQFPEVQDLDRDGCSARMRELLATPHGLAAAASAAGAPRACASCSSSSRPSPE
jgi:type II secretory pathway pseudopilin PulG